MPNRVPKKRAAAKAGMVKSPYSQGQVDAFVGARDRTASGNPAAVRKAFIAPGPVQVGGLTVQPLSIGNFWLLEEIESPFAGKAGSETDLAPISYRQIGEAAFILVEPENARIALGGGRESFTEAAFAFACRVPIADLTALTAALEGRAQEAQEMMPPPPATDAKNPSVPPVEAQVSAGG